MEHKSFAQLHDTAAVTTTPPLCLARDERLERWAEVLEREPKRRLSSLHRLEFVSRSERDTVRTDDSPLSIAFADPLLRANGLADDTYGKARIFFGLSNRQAHRVLCSCLNGPSIEARHVASALRKMVSQTSAWTELLQTLRLGLFLLFPVPRRG